ncbi:C4-dicarboxylate ABC transporter [Pistricoccus aurantiacus]|uniref:C4-dicarboxylate ABC transporter n=1 Tax=Pistricoccus aurantiacus TaxID=1883414 RepID=A0A5B8SM48_9GAMM|nr:tellurite resistance/C4-dicarboxylate transporter family protein [Pistricoccus aurantiacus]QEA38222.1 C4-dicarboxylate ABC transporter [Pistricoccus aurantiacus]
MASGTQWSSLLKAATLDLPPAYFGMVMATGIISLAAHMLGLTLLAYLLFYLNIVAYGVLWLLHGLRLVWFPRRFMADMLDHARGPGYFTWVASSAVLGTQFVVLAHSYNVALALWILTSLLWLGLTYTFFTVSVVKKDKPPLQEGINGSWLLAVVATQSVAVLSAHIAADWPQPYRLELNFLALSMWLWGGMLYIWMISLIFYRYYFFPFSPSDLAPPFWISMGAMAISTLAGSLLIANSPDAPYLESLLPFLKGFTIFYWATGTWWVPMLFLLGIWRHVIRRFPLEYDPLYWGAVFPMGMYTAATHQMNQAMEFGFLEIIPDVFLYIALLAWGMTFFGLLHSISRHARLHLGRKP